MMKYCFILVGFLFATNALAANNDGFYVGIDVGHMQATFDHTIQRRNPPGPKQSAKDTATAFVAGIDGGYRWYFNRYTVASELYYFNDNLSHTKFGFTSNTTKKLASDYGIKIMPGYLVLPQLTIQGIVGAAMGQLEYNSTGGSDSLTTIYSEPGYLLGAGLDYAFSQHLHINASFEYTYFQSKENVNGNTSSYIRDGSTFFKRGVTSINYLF